MILLILLKGTTAIVGSSQAKGGSSQAATMALETKKTMAWAAGITKIEVIVAPKNGSWKSTARKLAIFATNSNAVLNNISAVNFMGTKRQ